ncbi:MAG: patatin-like phospholipase family protein, partial [Fusobacteriaceae bacterium]
MKILKLIFILICILWINFISYSADEPLPTTVKNIPEKSSIKNTKEMTQSIDGMILELRQKEEILKKFKEALIKKNINVNDPNFKNKNYKIALVLSGGGAKGAAQIGVLKVLEEYKIPIDFIVGTSIGSIVGGMYSVGYTPDEIQEELLNLNSGTLMSNEKSRKYKDASQRFESYKTPFTLRFDERFNMRLPAGIYSGENIYFQLKDIFWRSELTENFDDLPIPFRAVTTRLEDGKEIVIDRGDLALAAYKSMSIPGFFDPANDSGTLYVDGGVTNNFPVDVALKMGADIIIAVDITGTTKIGENSTIIDIITKLSSYNGEKKTQDNKNISNVLIVPDVKSHGTVNFTNLEPVIEKGVEATHQIADGLKKLSNPEKFEGIQLKKNAQLTKEILIDTIEIRGTKNLSQAEVERLRPRRRSLLLFRRTDYNYMTAEDISIWSKKISNIESVARVFYQVEGDKIIFSVEDEKAVGANFGFNFSSDLGVNVSTALTYRDLIIPHSALIASASFSKFSDFDLTERFTFDAGPLQTLIQLKGGYESFPTLLLDPAGSGKQIAYLNNEDLYGEASLSLSLSNNTKTTFKSRFRNVNVTNDSIFDIPETKAQYIKNSITFRLDTLNQNVYPTAGVSFYF